MTELYYSLAGALVGFLVGMTGVGGGSLMAPILVLGFGFSPSLAVGTDLWFATFTKIVGGVVHRRFGSPDWTVIGRLAMGSVPAAILTLLYLGFAEGGKLNSDLLMKLLGAMLVVTAVLVPIKHIIHAPVARIRALLGERLGMTQLAVTIAAGAVVGCLVTLTSIGAGALVAVVLMFLYPLRLNAKSLVGTDIVHAIPLALIAAIGHSWLGNVNWELLGMLLIGSIPGVIAGSFAAGKIGETWVRVALAAMLAFSGVKMLTA
ncbi:putative membrane protein YfcA [Novosphingobium chloroacetimidivorans]|uniref:Probable membrane transporter protein n=1 Tax=Novosphingobium chloroacetimidivorans TaxID=1428314 RepID=A0A7W7NUI8_9SPHN|nr:sulfite exporter TauE/SafE family protein [Novosphingobium chloroacetimidivorans]MBB4857256.1 putative membrane protein YfcA [Novosphingobium chloroacetimidivorans]